jgi:hypothetical protein
MGSRGEHSTCTRLILCKPFIPAKFYEHTPILQQGRQVSAAVHGVLFTRFAMQQPALASISCLFNVSETRGFGSIVLFHKYAFAPFNQKRFMVYLSKVGRTSFQHEKALGMPTRLLTGLQQKMDSGH